MSEISALKTEIEFMSGFEVVEDMLLIEEVLQDKRLKELKKFMLAENLIIFDSFYSYYERYLIHNVMALNMIDTSASAM